MGASGKQNETRGIILVFVSYVIWGLFPLYWCLLENVPPVEIALHRMVWCALFAAAIVQTRKRWAAITLVLSTWRKVGALMISGLLVAADWTFYIWGVASHQLVQASLGLFIMPLVSILLGVVLLGERISPMRAVAMGLGIAALAVQIIAFGHMPWIAFGIAVSFGLYGYVRKTVVVDPLDGLFVETALLAPFAAVALIVMGLMGAGAFTLSLSQSNRALTDVLLICGGAVTAIPLALFVSGARRIRLSTVGFVQYFSPGLTLSLAVFGFKERFSPVDAAAFGCLWSALILVWLESWIAKRRASA
ncbi:MAG: EamA family transporter RarD [Rhizomicrobium sp.]